MNTCILLFMLTCPGVPASAKLLTSAQAVASFTDTWSTQRLFDQSKRAGIPVREANPLARPFQSHGKAVAYASTAAGVWGTAWLADRMRRSDNHFLNRAWWVPQTVLSVFSGYGVDLNLAVHRSRNHAQR